MKVKISQIKANSKNPRIIKDDKFKKLVQSIREFPEMLEKRPLVCFTDVDGKYVVLGGNMRLKAAQEVGLKELPIVLADDWTQEQRDEFLIKDNVGFGEWDWDQLANEWDADKLDEWGLDVPNFDTEVLEAEEDDFDTTPPENPITVLGDLYEIGEHRLLCGDSTDSDAVAKLMNGQKADMVFTSPPYNSGDVAMRGGGKFAFGKTGAKTLYENYKDDKTPQEYFDFCISILNNISLIVNELHSIFWNVSYNANSRDDYGKIVFADVNPFRVKETIIWNKGVAIPITSEGILSRNSEFIFLMSNGNKYLTNQKIGEHSVYWNTWNISSSGSQKNEHKACFPVELPFKAIEDFSKSDSIIYEPFTGSGTTIVAAQQLKRKCYGMELDPKYCDVIVNRMIALDPSIEIKLNGKPFEKAH
jgi:DNA modification methylase